LEQLCRENNQDHYKEVGELQQKIENLHKILGKKRMEIKQLKGEIE
jgi:hypothetical protein